ncbi:MAG: hypothetical protein CM1200mP20_14520 [Pseudomonadota bacterium]|nr:MAG: hypothetical protein CM1200mP20_14520 [Pseudomonadota bacterium]
MLHRPNAAARRSAGCIGSCLAGFALYLVLCVSSLAQSAHVRQAQVRHVVDGDTLVLDNGETVRLAGINAPELGQKGQPDQPLAAEATRALRELVGAGTVVVEEAMEREDRHGRTLAYLTTTDGRRSRPSCFVRASPVQSRCLPTCVIYNAMRKPNAEHWLKSAAFGVCPTTELCPRHQKLPVAGVTPLSTARSNASRSGTAGMRSVSPNTLLSWFRVATGHTISNIPRQSGPLADCSQGLGLNPG